jgi:hypothetical protein
MPIAQTISKADARAALSHARQIARAKERAHQERLTAGYKAKKASNVIQLRSQAKITSNEAVVAKREEIRAAHQVENDQRRLQQATSTQPSIPRRAASATVSGISYAGQSANRSSSPAGALFLIMFVIAALILWYYVVSHPQTSGFLGKLGDILHAVSSTQPLFSAITNTQASVPSEGVGVGAVGTPPAPSSPPTP